MCCSSVNVDVKVTTLLTMQNSDNSMTFRGTRLVKCYSYHARTSTKYLFGCKYAVYNKEF